MQKEWSLVLVAVGLALPAMIWGMSSIGEQPPSPPLSSAASAPPAQSIVSGAGSPPSDRAIHRPPAPSRPVVARAEAPEDWDDRMDQASDRWRARARAAVAEAVAERSEPERAAVLQATEILIDRIALARRQLRAGALPAAVLRGELAEAKQQAGVAFEAAVGDDAETVAAIWIALVEASDPL